MNGAKLSQLYATDSSLIFKPLEGKMAKALFGPQPWAFYVSDHLGNTRLVYRLDDCSGVATAPLRRTLEAVYDYFPYGQPLRQYEPTPNRFRLTGKEHDTETNTEDFGARAYDPDLVRWMSIDPLRHKYAGWSSYNYVMGNPLSLIDPDGREPNDRWKRTIHANGSVTTEWVSNEGGHAVDYVTTVDLRKAPRADAIKTETLSVRIAQNNGSIRQDNRYEPGLRYDGSPKSPAIEGVDLSDFTPTKAGFSGGVKLGMALFFATTKKADDVVEAVLKNVVAKTSTSIWSSTSKLSSVKNAFKHWNDHGAEFPEFINAKKYVEGAKNFLHNSPAGTLMKTRANGDILKYHPGTNTFGVMNAAGAPRTMFRPTNGMDYWLGQ